MLRQEAIEELIKQNLPLAARIIRENNVTGPNDVGYAFIISGLKLLFPRITDKKLAQCITDGQDDGNFDAFVFSKDKKIISIFDFKTSGFGLNDARLFRDSINDLVFSTQQPLVCLNPIVKSKLKETQRLLKSGWKVNIYIIRKTTGNANRRIEEIFIALKNRFPLITSFNLLEVNSLVKTFLKLKSEEHCYEWDLKIAHGSNVSGYPDDKILIRNSYNGPLKAMFTRVTLRDIVELQKKFIERGLDLFDANVRDFKKNDKLSTKIITSIKDNPESFYILHNGLTFSCAEIAPQTGYHYKILNPQIINGCQTVRTIYSKYQRKLNYSNLKKASVLCRFYALEPQRIEKVCEATNTQLKIDLWDLRSNDEIQKIFEFVLRTKRIDYKRKPTNKTESKVFITDLAQWIYACKFEKPAEAKNKKSSLFDILIENPPYRKIFSERMSLEEIAKICEIAFFVKKKIKNFRKNKLPFGKDADFHFMAGIYKLENKQWSFDSKFNRIKKIIEDAIKGLRSQYGRDLTFNKIFTKKEETWNLIRDKIDLI